MPRFSLNRLLYGAFFLQKWTIGIAQGSAQELASWSGRFDIVRPLRGGDFLADPIPVPGYSGRVFLCEWMRAKSGRGVIARVEIDGHARITDLSVLIDIPGRHLSYPHLVEIDGELYCGPEDCESKALTLYRLSRDARSVLSSRVSLEGFACVDPTIFRHGGRWWLFCTDARLGGSNRRLHAFHALHPFQGWTPHRLNPIKEDISGARPAGPVFEVAGSLFRPAQNCRARYGGGLRLFRIERLGPDDFAESEHWSLHSPFSSAGKDGVHTISGADGHVLFDVCEIRFSPLAWYFRALERVHRN